jgi:hypothetical protein
MKWTYYNGEGKGKDKAFMETQEDGIFGFLAQLGGQSCQLSALHLQGISLLLISVKG